MHNLGAIADSLHGDNSTFPGPNRPQLSKKNIKVLDYERNNMTILGGYTNKLYFNLIRILPFLGRLGDLLERESLVTKEEERREIEILAQNMSVALSEMNKAITPLTPLLENLKIGKNVGESKIINNNESKNIFIKFLDLNLEESKNNNLKTEIISDGTNKIKINQNNTLNPEIKTVKNNTAESNKQNKGNMDFGSIFSEMMKPDNMNSMMGLLGNMGGENGSQPDLSALMGSLGPMMSQLTGGGSSGGGNGLMNMMNMMVIIITNLDGWR